MSNVIIPLLVWKKGSEPVFDVANKTPEVRYVPQDSILEVKDQVSGIGFGSQVVVKRGDGATEVLHCFESAFQIKALENPATDNYFAKAEVDLGANLLSTTQGNGVAVSKFFTTFDGGSDGSAEAADLPAAVKGGVHVVINENAFPAEVFPASGEDVNGGAANAVYSQAANSTVYYYCVEDGSWKVLVAG